MLWIMCLVLLAGCNSEAFAERIAGHDINTWADAIYKAEGGSHTRHPYGILAKYRHTSPRAACINTLRHQARNWAKEGHPGPFLAYLQRHYAPLYALNDPKGLNRNWQRNVSYFLERGNG